MKHHTSTVLTIAPRPLSENSALSKMAEIENTIARRAYELFASSGFTNGHDLEDWLFAESELLDGMPVEITETEKKLAVNAGLPGFTEKDIEIRVEPRRLFISGKREEKSENKKKGETVYSERSNQVFRTIDLPGRRRPGQGKRDPEQRRVRDHVAEEGNRQEDHRRREGCLMTLDFAIATPAKGGRGLLLVIRGFRCASTRLGSIFAPIHLRISANGLSKQEYCATNFVSQTDEDIGLSGSSPNVGSLYMSWAMLKTRDFQKLAQPRGCSAYALENENSDSLCIAPVAPADNRADDIASE